MGIEMRRMKSHALGAIDLSAHLAVDFAGCRMRDYSGDRIPKGAFGVNQTGQPVRRPMVPSDNRAIRK
jgi:hypothetical protein